MVRIEVNARHCFSEEDRRLINRFFRPDFLPDTGVNFNDTEWSICFWVERFEGIEQVCSDTVHFVASRVRIWSEDRVHQLIAEFAD